MIDMGELRERLRSRTAWTLEECEALLEEVEELRQKDAIAQAASKEFVRIAEKMGEDIEAFKEAWMALDLAPAQAAPKELMRRSPRRGDFWIEVPGERFSGRYELPSGRLTGFTGTAQAVWWGRSESGWVGWHVDAIDAKTGQSVTLAMAKFVKVVPA